MEVVFETDSQIRILNWRNRASQVTLAFQRIPLETEQRLFCRNLFPQFSLLDRLYLHLGASPLLQDQRVTDSD